MANTDDTGGNKGPKSDPTEAVKEALTLAIRNLDEKFAAQILNITEGIKLARGELKDQLVALNSTIAERFIANKDLVDQLAKANAVALSAALQTQKESAAKSEVSMADLLKQLQSSFDSANKATNEKIDRLTSRLDTGEGTASVTDPATREALRNMTVALETLQAKMHVGQGGTEQKKQDFSVLYMVIGVIVAVAAIAIPILTRH